MLIPDEPRRVHRARAVRRRRLIALAAIIGVLAGGGLWAVTGDEPGSTESDPARATGTVRVTAGGTEVLREDVETLRRMSRSRIAAVLGRVPTTRTERRGAARVTLRTNRPALEGAVWSAVRSGGGTVTVPEDPVESSARLPIVQQVLRNNCETAALSMLLAARDIQAEQLDLQRDLPRSGPPDPSPSPTGGLSTWGDPRRGFVGRPEGGGTSGGYGVYEGPVRDLAARRGARLDDLSRSSPAAIYRRLLSGRQVMVWVGLSDGPFETWLTPEGEELTGNFGEHTVVLIGLRGDQVAVNDPLVGERTTWTRAYFEELWERLGRRALST